MAYSEILKNIYLFKEFTHEELEPIQKLCRVGKANNGDTIFFQGDEAKSLFIVQFGSVHVQQKAKNDDNIEVTMLGTGSHFGEMPFLDGERRSATVLAAEKSEIIEIDYENLKKYLSTNSTVSSKFYKNIAGFLCGRLRMTTTDLSFAREKNLHHF
ncbi:MAG: cyclic nucleotide-binding domain-containing protein [Oligoflexia bacterium]|nr:cyclic nucleotide-binding domain-containing protein [Oligoflexia bacterium]